VLDEPPSRIRQPNIAHYSMDVIVTGPFGEQNEVAQ